MTAGARLALSIALGVGLAACERFPPDDGPAAFVIVPATSTDQGMAVIEAVGSELPLEERRLVQVRSFVDGQTSTVMVRFAGSCGNKRFVAAVQRVANAHKVGEVRCVAKLPPAV